MGFVILFAARRWVFCRFDLRTRGLRELGVLGFERDGMVRKEMDSAQWVLSVESRASVSRQANEIIFVERDTGRGRFHAKNYVSVPKFVRGFFFRRHRLETSP